jgi:hypothetical protein
MKKILLVAAALLIASPVFAEDHPVHGLSCVAKTRIIVTNGPQGEHVAYLKRGDRFDIVFSDNTADLVDPGYQVIQLGQSTIPGEGTIKGWIKDDSKTMKCSP